MVLFIQGVGVHGDGWLPQTDDLARDFTCITFDNRGMGKSVPASTAITTKQMAADALAILDAAGATTTAHVVGHSLGGVVALELALLARARVASLALLCTFSGGKTAAPLTPRMIWLGMRTRVGTRAMRRRGFMQLVMPPGVVADSNAVARLAVLFGHDLADQPPIAGAQLAALQKSDTSPRLAGLAGLPTLVMAAAHDPIAPPAAGQALAGAIAGACYLEVPDASHGLPISHAALTNASLRKHLGRPARPNDPTVVGN